MRFPIETERDDNGTILVTCPSLPEVTTFADDDSDVFDRAKEAVEEALAGRIDQWQDIRAPDLHDLSYDAVTALSSLASIKVQLFIACRENNVTRADLGLKLGWPRHRVDQLFRLDHATRLDEFDAAFNALGRELQTEVVTRERDAA